jgi:hypothetical protein
VNIFAKEHPVENKNQGEVKYDEENKGEDEVENE